MQVPILVTGGAGYIGAHACKALARAGFLPIAYDNLSTGHKHAVKWGPFIEADLLDKDALKKAFQEFQPQAVLHFAASAIISESMENPSKYYTNNVYGTVSLLEAMVEAGVLFLIFSSTCATYGHPESLPIVETHPQRPISPYGKSKWMAEQILADFANAYGLLSVSLRYFNAAGADSDLEIGEDQTPITRLISSAIDAALFGKTLPIYGTNFMTKDGTAFRDYLHVEDLAHAHVLALEWLFTHKKSEAINLGSGRGYSVLEIIAMIEKLSHKKIATKVFPKREGDPSILIADLQKAQKLLGWQPIHPLSQIIESALDWCYTKK